MGTVAAGAACWTDRGARGHFEHCLRVADEVRIALLDLKDLQSLLGLDRQDASTLALRLCNCLRRLVGAISGGSCVLENQGALTFLVSCTWR